MSFFFFFFFLCVSQKGSLGNNPASFSVPLVVPNSAFLLRGAAGGNGGDLTQMLGRPTGPSDVVLPRMDENPPLIRLLCMLCLAIG